MCSISLLLKGRLSAALFYFMTNHRRQSREVTPKPEGQALCFDFQSLDSEGQALCLKGWTNRGTGGNRGTGTLSFQGQALCLVSKRVD